MFFLFFPSRASKQFISPFCFCQQFFSQDFSFPFPKHSGSVPITSIWHPLSWKKVVGHWKYVFRFILLSDQMTPECHRWRCLIYCYLARVSFCYNNVFYLCFEAAIRNLRLRDKGHRRISEDFRIWLNFHAWDLQVFTFLPILINIACFKQVIICSCCPSAA